MDPGIKFEESFSWKDTLAASFTHDDKYVITSPNVAYIPQPYVGLIRVVMRSDFRYGENDPFQWPQPFDEQLPFLCAIRHPYPSDHRYAPIWWTPSRDDFDIVEGSAFTSLGLLKRTAIAPLEHLAHGTSTLVDKHLESIQRHAPLLSLYRRGMNEARDRIQYFPATFRDTVFQVREVQRFWLLCRAYMDYSSLSSRQGPALPVEVGYIS